MRWRWSKSIGPSSGTSGGDGIQATCSREYGIAAIRIRCESEAERNPAEPITELVNRTFRVQTAGSIAIPGELD
jgi:hypothetical protein